MNLVKRGMTSYIYLCAGIKHCQFVVNLHAWVQGPRSFRMFYFILLEMIFKENQYFDKSGQIFNMDESGLQLNNKAEFVVAANGSKNVAAITAAEKRETITIISCFTAERTYIPA